MTSTEYDSIRKRLVDGPSQTYQNFNETIEAHSLHVRAIEEEYHTTQHILFGLVTATFAVAALPFLVEGVAAGSVLAGMSAIASAMGISGGILETTIGVVNATTKNHISAKLADDVLSVTQDPYKLLFGSLGLAWNGDRRGLEIGVRVGTVISFGTQLQAIYGTISKPGKETELMLNWMQGEWQSATDFPKIMSPLPVKPDENKASMSSGVQEGSGTSLNSLAASDAVMTSHAVSPDQASASINIQISLNFSIDFLSSEDAHENQAPHDKTTLERDLFGTPPHPVWGDPQEGWSEEPSDKSANFGPNSIGCNLPMSLGGTGSDKNESSSTADEGSYSTSTAIPVTPQPDAPMPPAASATPHQ